jgi:hypothetical protein
MKTTGAGVSINGIIFDAGAKRSSVLLQVGGGGENDDSARVGPAALHDVFFRIGGAAAGKVRTALIVNSDNTILDDIWAWRADHGNGVGWTSNTADTGVVVNGDNVTASFKVGRDAESFHGYGMGIYTFFNQGIDIFAERAFEVPSSLPPGSMRDMVTVFLNGNGGIRHVINESGASANKDNHVVYLVSYP